MRRAGAFWVLLLLSLQGFTGQLHAQEEDTDIWDDSKSPPLESEWDIYMPDLYSKGDKIFSISLGVIFPTVFFHQGEVIEHKFVPVGGTGALSYSYFFGAHFNLGGEVSGMFNYTLGESTVFIVPIGLRIGYQFVINRFEIPLTGTIGFAPQRYLNLGLISLYLKGGAAVYYRFSPDWSFGINSNWGWFPQWTKEPSKNVYGNIVDLTLSARYHF